MNEPRRSCIVYEYLRSVTLAFHPTQTTHTHFVEFSPKGANHSDSERGRLISVTVCEDTSPEEVIAAIAHIEQQFTTDYRWLRMS